MTAVRIALRLDGDGALFGALDATATRLLYQQICNNNAITRFERTWFDRDDDRRSALLDALRWGRTPLTSAQIAQLSRAVSYRVFAGQWRLHGDEGALVRERKRDSVLALYGMLFVLDRIDRASLVSGPARDIVALSADRAFRLLRFERLTRDNSSLSIELRDRTQLDRLVRCPLAPPRSEQRWLRCWTVRAALPREGFSLTTREPFIRR